MCALKIQLKNEQNVYFVSNCIVDTNVLVLYEPDAPPLFSFYSCNQFNDASSFYFSNRGVTHAACNSYKPRLNLKKEMIYFLIRWATVEYFVYVVVVVIRVSAGGRRQLIRYLFSSSVSGSKVVFL